MMYYHLGVSARIILVSFLGSFSFLFFTTINLGSHSFLHPCRGRLAAVLQNLHATLLGDGFIAFKVVLTGRDQLPLIYSRYCSATTPVQSVYTDSTRQRRAAGGNPQKLHTILFLPELCQSQTTNIKLHQQEKAQAQHPYF